MQFEESFFQGEEREGFYVSSMMKRFWASQIEVLLVIDEICERNNIKYFAYAGTLIGAIRHKGYIPWDDDLDICMLREDYDRFYEVAKKQLPEEYVILTAKEDAYGTIGVNGLFMRVTNGHEINFTKEYMEKYHGCPYVTGIDIFVFDYVPRNEADHQLRNELFNIVSGTAACLERNPETEEEKKEIEESIKQIEEVCNYHFNDKTSMIGQLYYLADRISAMYTREEADTISIVRHLNDNYEWSLRKDVFDDIVRTPFENIMIPIPVNYDEYLRVAYGDYMTPKQTGAKHDYPVYQDQERAVIERFGGIPECIRYE